MTRRGALAGLLAGLLLLGCSISAGTEGEPDAEPARATPAPSLSADAATTAEAVDKLRAGTTFVDRTSFRADGEVAGQVSTLAHTDNVKKRATTSVSTSAGVLEIRMIDDEVYLRTDLDYQGVGKEWMVLDPGRVPADFALTFAPGRNDPGGSARLIGAIVTARVDGSRITGTLDLTRVGVGNGFSFPPGPNGTFPDSFRSHGFRATLDDEGRLVSFLLPAANGVPNASLRYSDFGAAFTVVRPKGAVVAPDALYAQLGLPGGK